MKQNKTVLPNGLTVITVEKPHSFTVATGISVSAGSFNEESFPIGTAHFLEHMLFKETTNRSNKEINNEMNVVGGELNAFTYYEETKYYAITPKDSWHIGLNLLIDVISNNTIPEKEIEKERNVIFEEIKMYGDDPTSILIDSLQEKMFEDYPERYGVIGTEETVSEITREDLIRFLHTYYHPENMTVVVTGAVSHEEVLEKANTLHISYPKLPETKKTPFVRVPLSGHESLYENAEQSHFAFGLFGPSIKSSQTAAFEIINIVLGGNESSRLFTKIREERGISYMLNTNTEYLSDYGAMYGLIGSSEEYFEEIESIIEQEMVNISEQGITLEELLRAKSYLKGKAMMEYESNTALNDYISSAFLYGESTDPQDYIEELEKVTMEDVHAVAQEYFTLDNYFTIALIGEREEYEVEEEIKQPFFKRILTALTN